MHFSDFKCGRCGHIERRWEQFSAPIGSMLINMRCPVFQCMFDNGYDIIYFENSKEKTERLGVPMTFMGCFKEFRSIYAELINDSRRL